LLYEPLCGTTKAQTRGGAEAFAFAAVAALPPVRRADRSSAGAAAAAACFCSVSTAVRAAKRAEPVPPGSIGGASSPRRVVSRRAWETRSLLRLSEETSRVFIDGRLDTGHAPPRASKR